MLRSCPTWVDGKGRRHTRRDVPPVRRPPQRAVLVNRRCAWRSVQLGLDATDGGGYRVLGSRKVRVSGCNAATGVRRQADSTAD